MANQPFLSIDLQALRAFATVGRVGNITRAAEKLHRSQPAVSLQIKTLNDITGLKLLHRTSQGMELTTDGATLLPLAEKVLSVLNEFSNVAASLHETVHGQLRIGTILDPEFIRLGAFLLTLVKSYPQIDTALHHNISGVVLDRIERGELDIGFYLKPPDEQLRSSIMCKGLTHFTYRVLAPAGWGPKVKGKDWKALASLPWLETPPASVHNRLQRRVFGPGSLTGLEPRRVAMVDQESSMLDLVRSGLGLSLVRDSIAIHESQTRGLVMADHATLDCELSVVCLADRASNPEIVAALSTLDFVWDAGSAPLYAAF